MIAAVTPHGGAFYYQFDGYMTKEHARKFVLVLSNEFDGDFIVATMERRIFKPPKSLISATKMALNSSDYRRVRPILNPVEECSRQLKERPRNRFFESKEELEAAIQDGLLKIRIPTTSNYL